MIVSKHFVFIHVPKTGGSFIRKILLEKAPEDWDLREISGHVPISEVPEEYAGLPAFAFVRNPFDWYVSWYTFLRAELLMAGIPNEFFSRMSKRGTRSFRNTLETIFADEALKAKQCDCFFRGSVFGCHLNTHLGNDLTRIRIGKLERLQDDLSAILTEYSDAPRAMLDAVHSQSKVNVSLRDHYRSYYDKELREMVSIRDRQVLDYFHYQF